MNISQMSSSSVYSTDLYSYNNQSSNKSKRNLESLTTESSGSMDNIKISQQGRMMSRMSDMPDVSSMSNDEFREMLTSMQDDMQKNGVDTSNMQDPSQLSDIETEQMKAQMQKIQEKMQEKMSGMTSSSGMTGKNGMPPSGKMSGMPSVNGMSGSSDINSLLSTINSEDSEDDSSSSKLYSKTSYELRQMLNDGSITQSEYNTEIARRDASKSDKDYDAQVARNQKAIEAYTTVMNAYNSSQKTSLTDLSSLFQLA